MATETRRESPLERYRDIRRRYRIDDITHKLRQFEEELRSGGEQSVLGLQLEEARQQGIGARKYLKKEPPALLILTVGTSPEPLLLAVAFHNPRRVALLKTEELERSAWETLQKLWKEHREALGELSFPGGRHENRIVEADPAQVFQAVRYLARRAKGEPGDVVLDISGAKKSMIAGSFLAAGYLDLQATYVDFESYDPALRRPEPGPSRLCTLPNPYRLFRLKERQRLVRAFDQRHFGEALGMIDDFLASLEEEEVVSVLGELATAAEKQRLMGLRGVCRVYLDWSEGFFKDAYLAAVEAEGFQSPPVVEILKVVWPEREDQSESSKEEDEKDTKKEAQRITGALAESELFEKPARALAYLCDLLIWSDHEAQSKNPRSLFLRLFGGIEALIYTAFDTFSYRMGSDFQLVLEAEAVEKFKKSMSIDSLALEGSWFDYIQDRAHESVRVKTLPALRLLAGKACSYQEEALKGVSKRLRADLQEVAKIEMDGKTLRRQVEGLLQGTRVALARPPLSSEEHADLTDGNPGLESFREIRNKAIHWLAPVPVSMTRGLRTLFTRFIETLVPRIVEELLANPGEKDVSDLELWSQRLLAVASGEVPEPGLRPMTFAEATRQLEASLGSREKESRS